MSGALAPAAYAGRFAKTVNYLPTASLTTPTYDASGVTTEPTWILKPSWVTATGTDLLAHNPLTGGSNTVENPSLLISNDQGATWATPPGLTNPIAGPPASGNYADCHLIADPNTNRLIMTWTAQAQSVANQGGIWYSICTDVSLVTWGSPTQLLQVNGVGNAAAGPNEQESKLVWDTVRGKYLLFTQDQGAPNSIKMRIAATSNPVGSYGAPTTCSLTLPNGSTPWHMDIIQVNGRFIMAFCDNGATRNGWLASSSDGLHWQCAPRTFMKDGTWSQFGPYRPSIQPARSGSGYDLIVARVQVPDARLGVTRNVPASEVP